MKKSTKFLSILLVVLMMVSFAACNSGSESSEESGIISESSSTDTSSGTESSEATSENEESSESTDTSENSELQSEESSLQSEASSVESEAQSEEPSSVQSEESSKEEQSTDGLFAMNPYFGTDIKPAEGKVIAFTFDDGPSYTKSTEKILDKLEELGMKATFFMVGERVSAGTAPVIKRMVELGCDIGNHSYDHPNFNSMTTAQVKKQIADTNAKLEKFAGVKATLIRPPYGNIKDSQMEALNTPIICWDIDSLDWDLRNAQKIYDRTIAKVHSGGIILMHDIYDTTAEAFCMLADKLVADGYTLVTISELLGTDKLMCTTIKYGFKW